MKQFNPEKEGGNKESLRNIDLGPLAGWVGKYNQDFGPFARQLRAGLLKIPGELEQEEVEGEEEPEEKEKGSAQAAQAEILQRNSALAEQVGLSLSFPSGQEDEAWALELRVDVADGALFTKYLRSMTEIDPSASQLEGLAKIAEVLGSQLTNGYDLTDANNGKLLELASSLKGVTEVYTRLGEKHPEITSSATSLAELYKAVRGGYLKEYNLIKEQRLLTPIGEGFGPGNWHTDMSDDSYIKSWNSALDTLREIGRNPKAKGFQERVRAHLLACLEDAEEDMKAKESSLLKNNRIPPFIEATKEKLK